MGQPLNGRSHYNAWTQFGKIWSDNDSLGSKLSQTWRWLNYSTPDAAQRRQEYIDRMNAENAKWATIDAVRGSGFAGIAVTVGKVAGASDETIARLAQTGVMLEGIAGSVTGAYQQTLTAKAPLPNRVAARPQESGDTRPVPPSATGTGMGGAIKGGTVAAQGGAEASEAQNIATNAIKAGNGEGIFPSSDIKPYNPSNVVYGQLNDASCVAGSCRMAIAPQLGDVPEAYIRSAIGTSSDGTSLSNVPQGLRDLGFDGSVNYVTDAGAQSVSSATQNGSTVIVNVKSPLGDIHAVVVDSVVDGRVYIRDPWPPGTGSAYSVSAESFNNSMTGSAVIIKGK